MEMFDKWVKYQECIINCQPWWNDNTPKKDNCAISGSTNRYAHYPITNTLDTGSPFLLYPLVLANTKILQKWWKAAILITPDSPLNNVNQRIFENIPLIVWILKFDLVARWVGQLMEMHQIQQTMDFQNQNNSSYNLSGIYFINLGWWNQSCFCVWILFFYI